VAIPAANPRPNQPQVEVHVLQGERKMAIYNRTLGKFSLAGIPPAPRGMPQIEVTFDIDANGILNVSAKDKGTGKEQKIVIQSSSGLSKDEVERMRKDAEAHSAEDDARRALAEARNKAESAIYETEKLLKEHGDKAPADVRERIESKKKAVAEAKASDDPKKIEAAVEALMEASQEVAKKLYEEAAKSSPGAAGPSSASEAAKGTGAGGPEDVIDADFEKK